ncbi:hypothetical protein [Actinocrispum wychmicini]|uniref:Uncharacterized protein n=1 Tax=Actinocrispum wychmicini TaxID=1213861 RepID=A0A4R2KG61_9PSEU|nr:hypothetical protein [Actinocrispum wychmicini]TCO65415.1 hypothetical protein EV192_1011207 [Actinocrispum wychmicini]
MPGDEARFLVLHDYGMGGVWWWIRARSARQIRETFAEVEVVTEADAIELAGQWNLDEVDIDAPVMPAVLTELRAQREAQRTHPDFAALAGRTILYLRIQWDGDDPADYLTEVGNDGRRLRQVEVSPDGTELKTDPDDWAFNPPAVDLFDPDLVGKEISQEEFEAAWRRARHDDT